MRLSESYRYITTELSSALANEIMTDTNTVVLLASLLATINLAEQASLDINVLRQLSRRHVEGHSSGNITANVTTRLSETKDHQQRSATVEGRCATKSYRKTISPRRGCQAQVEIGMCYGNCVGYTVPADNRNSFKPHCKCCRPTTSELAVFRVDCSTSPPTAKRHHHNSRLRSNQYLVRIQEATACSCRPVRCLKQ